MDDTTLQNGSVGDAVANLLGNDPLRIDLYEAGICYLKQGWQIVVCDGKRPTGGKNWQRKTINESLLPFELQKPKQPAIGVKLGPASGIVDVEADSDAEEKLFADLFKGCDIPVTPTYRSRRGKHRLFKWDERLAATGAAVINFQGGKAKLGVRIGAGDKGAQSVFPPSPGREWLVSPDDCEPAELPDVVVERLLEAQKAEKPRPTPKHNSGKFTGSEGAHADCLKAMLVSTKNMQDESDGSKRLFAVACRAIEHDLSDDQAIATIRDYEAERPFKKSWTDAEILQRVRDAEKQVERGSASKDEDKGFTCELAESICQDNHFARDAGGKLYRYNSGTYRTKAEQYIKAQVKKLCIEWGKTKAWTRRLADEVVEFIRVDTCELWDRPPLDVVNVQNGLLRLTDGELLPHTPEHLSPVQLPVTYDPKATCPFIDKFISEVFPEDAVALGYELPAWLMTPDTSIQKAVLLLGAGGNGKSTYLAMVMAFLGRGNCVGLSLHKLESDKFAVARLLGKLANICPDLPTEHLSGTNTFKSITGTDFGLEGEIKFRDGFSFDPYCRLIFSANSPPRSSDASEGFFDRWLVVPFDARFRGTKKELTRKEIDSKLADPKELSGFLNRAVAAWQEIQHRSNRLSEPQSVLEAWEEFHATTDPLAVWLERHTIDHPDAVVPMQVLRTAYGAACEQAGRPTPTKTAFGQMIRRAKPEVRDKQRTVNSRLQWCYVGIGMASEGMGDSQTSRTSRTYPPISQTPEQTENGETEGEYITNPENSVNPVNGVNDAWGEL